MEEKRKRRNILFCIRLLKRLRSLFFVLHKNTECTKSHFVKGLFKSAIILLFSTYLYILNILNFILSFAMFVLYKFIDECRLIKYI